MRESGSWCDVPWMLRLFDELWRFGLNNGLDALHLMFGYLGYCIWVAWMHGVHNINCVATTGALVCEQALLGGTDGYHGGNEG